MHKCEVFTVYNCLDWNTQIESNSVHYRPLTVFLCISLYRDGAKNSFIAELCLQGGKKEIAPF